MQHALLTELLPREPGVSPGPPTRRAAQRRQPVPPAWSLTTTSGIVVMVTSLSSCDSRAWWGVMEKVPVQNPFTAFPENALKIVLEAFAAGRGQGVWVLQEESEIGLGFPGAILRSNKPHSRSFPPYCGSARSAWHLDCSTREHFARLDQIISIFYFASNIRQIVGHHATSRLARPPCKESLCAITL